jgi:hypothetical protein
MRLALDRACVPATDDRQLIHVRAREIGERLGLEVAPEVLDGIQLGRVRREMEVAGADSRKKVPDVGRAMRVGAIPYEYHRRPQMPRELFAEGQHGLGIEVFLDKQLEIQADGAPLAADAEGGDHRNLSAVPADVPEHRRASARSPGAPHHGQQKQPAFVDENQPRAQPVSFFLMRGQSCLTQRRISSSSRSQARRMGRCGVQPSDRSNRPM